MVSKSNHELTPMPQSTRPSAPNKHKSEDGGGGVLPKALVLPEGEIKFNSSMSMAAEVACAEELPSLLGPWGRERDFLAPLSLPVESPEHQIQNISLPFQIAYTYQKAQVEFDFTYLFSQFPALKRLTLIIECRSPYDRGKIMFYTRHLCPGADKHPIVSVVGLSRRGAGKKTRVLSETFCQEQRHRQPVAKNEIPAIGEEDLIELHTKIGDGGGGGGDNEGRESDLFLTKHQIKEEELAALLADNLPHDEINNNRSRVRIFQGAYQVNDAVSTSEARVTRSQTVRELEESA
ncbi:hypothetical protein DL95DRAFT_461742 [Leptodontidium sp. 2 PMI_412]|nr:hypothetical protein DL95DRAFT_461742 [Leptodontidium sp. 2 PMI_412]